jgi:hypothetical protein
LWQKQRRTSEKRTNNRVLVAKVAPDERKAHKMKEFVRDERAGTGKV